MILKLDGKEILDILEGYIASQLDGIHQGRPVKAKGEPCLDAAALSIVFTVEPLTDEEIEAQSDSEFDW